jgi:hypothetical protein
MEAHRLAAVPDLLFEINRPLILRSRGDVERRRRKDTASIDDKFSMLSSCLQRKIYP